MDTTLVSLINQYTPLKATSQRYYRGIEHDSLVVDAHKNAYFWNSQGEAGDAAAWLMHRENISYREALALLGEEKRTMTPIPPAPEPDLSDKIAALPSRAEYYHDSLTPQARAWWHRQGINDESINRHKLGFAQRCPTGPGVSYTIPYIEAGQVVNIRHRLLNESQGRYRPEFSGLGNSLFNIDGLARDSELNTRIEAVLVEGEKKAIVLEQAGFRAAGYSGINAWRPEWVKHFDGIDVVYIAADPGTAPEARRIAQDFAAVGKWAKVKELREKPDDLLNQGMTPADLLALLKEGEDIVKPRVKTRLELRLQILQDMSRRPELKEWQRPHYRAGAIPFEIGDNADYQELVVKLRSTYTSAKEWGDVVAERFPELDPAEEESIKLGENITERIKMCGQPYKRLTLTGEYIPGHIECGYCEKCKARDRENLRKALEEAAMASQGMALTRHIEETEEGKRKFMRQAKRAGVKRHCFPTRDGEYQIVLQGAFPELGDVLDPADLTDDLLKLWMDTPKKRRARGDLVLSKRDLKDQYRPRDPFEDPDPWQRDDAGRPITDKMTGRRVPRDDVQTITLPGIITDAPIPPLTIEHDVHDAEQLQKAIFELHERTVKVLARRGRVILGVIAKQTHTPKMTLPELLAEFNANQQARRARRKRKK